MKNIVVFAFIFFLFILLFSCDHDSNILTSNNPEWLDKLIEEIHKDNYYMGSVIYRHEWKSEYYYHLEIPVSSCAYCDVYNQYGKKIEWSKERDFEDYINNRKNEKVIWGWQSK